MKMSWGWYPWTPFSDREKLKSHKENLQTAIRTNSTICDRQLYIFDEARRFPPKLLDSLGTFSKHPKSRIFAKNWWMSKNRFVRGPILKAPKPLFWTQVHLIQNHFVGQFFYFSMKVVVTLTVRDISVSKSWSVQWSDFVQSGQPAKRWRACCWLGTWNVAEKAA